MHPCVHDTSAQSVFCSPGHECILACTTRLLRVCSAHLRMRGAMQEQLAAKVEDLRKRLKAERGLRKSCERWMRSELKSRVSASSAAKGRLWT